MQTIAVIVAICCSMVTAQRGSIHQFDDDVYFVGSLALSYENAKTECSNYNQGKIYNLSPENTTFAWKITNTHVSSYACFDKSKTEDAEREGKFYVAAQSDGSCMAFDRKDNSTSQINCNTLAFFICKFKGTIGETPIGRSRCSEWKLVNIQISQCCQFLWLNTTIDHQTHGYTVSLTTVRNNDCSVTYNVTRLGNYWSERYFVLYWNNVTKGDSNALCQANATCKDFRCDCDEGFESSRGQCTDVDECATNTYACHANSSCNNIVGSYNCACKPGFEGNGTQCTDIDECLIPGYCYYGRYWYRFAPCENWPGGYQCNCPEGYFTDNTSRGTFYCHDVDECSKSKPCAPNLICNNTFGSYHCTCNAGYYVNETNCEDVDECKVGDNSCHSNSTCNNTMGSYVCTCINGFNGNGINCEDTDECETDATDCHINSTCINTLGSYECICKLGFEGNGIDCEDVEECATNISKCHADATCLNTLGSYNCLCNNGFQANGTECTDINECETIRNTCHLHAICVNTVGSYNCTCKNGFIGNGSHCKDVDECAQDINVCHAAAICYNTLRSYNCTCKRGFKGNGTECADVDECTTNNNTCHLQAVCANMVGSYNCTCKDGYTGNGSHCEDIDECKNASNSCPENSNCTNVHGTYFCTCLDGFTGVGCESISVLQSKCITNPTLCEEKLSEELASSTTSTAGTESASDFVTKITSNQQSLPVTVTKSVAQFMKEVSDAALAGNITVTSNIASLMLTTTSNLLKSFKTQRSNSNNSNDLSELRRQQTEITQAISSLALQVELASPNDTFTYATDAILMKVQDTNVNVQAPLVFTPQLAVNSNTSEPSAIIIPQSVITKLALNRRKRSSNTSQSDTVRSAFLYFDNPTLFLSEKNVSSVISAALGNGSPVNNLTDPVRIQHKGENNRYGTTPLSNETRKSLKTTLECVHWDFNRSEWSTSGCCLDQTSDPVECRCNHLTNFALLVNSKTVSSDVALSIVSDIGCILSILGLTFTIIVHCLHRDMRRRRPAKILLNICGNLLVVYLIFVLGVSSVDAGHACTLVAVLLHYFMLTTWCWMAVYSYDMYMSVVKVFRQDAGRFLQRVSAFSYLTPLLVVVITLAVTFGHFDQQHEVDTNLCDKGDVFYSTYRAENMCWLTGYSLNIAFLLPVGILFLFNLGVFASVFREISCKSIEAQTSSMKRTNKQMLMIASSMSAIMGMTWVFGYLMLISNDEIYFSIMSWLFALFNTLQGLVIFFLTSVRSPELRKVWWTPIRSVISRGSSRVSDKIRMYSKSYQVSQSYEETTITTEFTQS